MAAVAATLAAAVALPSAAAAQTFPTSRQFQKVTLNDRPGEPMSLAVLPDGRVLHAARTGEIRLHNPRNGTNNIVTDMKDAPQGLYQHDEEGVQGIALDPAFEDNDWVYVYYSPKLNTPSDVLGTGINEGDAPENLTTDFDRQRLALFNGYALLSRFKFRSGKLDFTTEQEILRVNMSRGICCHVGGQIDFDGQGNLYLSTGDDTNPFQSAGYAPLDDRETRNPAFDSRRTSGNTNDLRGKLLRIRVGENGGYTIPQGNLFPQGTALTRPEIYAMGFRNPFRFSVNRQNGHVYVGDYSPDAQASDPAYGPEGIGRWMIVRQPANFGWPFCITPDSPYVDHDFTPDAPQSGEEIQLLRADQRLAQQHRPDPPAAGRAAGRLVLLQHGSGPVPGAVPAERRPATASGRWAGRRWCSTRRSSRRSGGRASSTGNRSSMSGPGTSRRSSSSIAPTATGWPTSTRCSVVRRPRRRTSCWTTRWTWSSGRTTRSMSSSTAPATSRSCPRRNWRGSTTSATASTRRSCGGRRRRPTRRPRR